MRTSLIGQRFGDLTVIDFSHINKHRNTCWVCQCDCGNHIIVSRNHLQQGDTKSCGCRKHGPEREDITGKRFGRLTVIKYDHDDIHRNSYWLCECDCGNKTVVTRGDLTSGNTTSCGCYQIECIRERSTRHGMSRTPLYKVWRDMRTRCENEHSTAYHRYGGRDIMVCDEWEEFENFHHWAMDNGYERGLTIDRINNDDNYSPTNCRWVTMSIQGNNRSSNHIVEYKGIKHNIMEWSKIFGVNYNTLRQRILRGDMRDFEEYFC